MLRRGEEKTVSVYLGELDDGFKSLIVFCYSDGYEYSTSSKKTDLEDEVSEL